MDNNTNSIRVSLVPLVVLVFVVSLLAGVAGAAIAGSRTIECGTCGAHVHDWWYVRSDTGNLIEVCEPCYLEARDM